MEHFSHFTSDRRAPAYVVYELKFEGKQRICTWKYAAWGQSSFGIERSKNLLASYVYITLCLHAAASLYSEGSKVYEKDLK